MSSMVGCDAGSSSKSANVRLVNASPGYASLDLYVDDQENDDGDELALEGVGFGTVSQYAKVDSGTYTLKFKRNGVSGTLQSSVDQKLTDESNTVYIGYGSSGHFAVLSISEDVERPDDGDTVVRVLNAAEGVGTLNVYFTESSVDLDNVSADFAGNGSKTMDSGTYRMRVTGSDAEDVRLDVPEITLENREVITLILTATNGGVLVNAMLLPQGGELSSINNTKARIRGAVGISNGITTTIRVGSETLISNATAGAIGNDYALIESGSVPILLTVDGIAAMVPDQTLVGGGDYTLLAWNDSSGTRATLISDDNRLPSGSAEAKIRLINGMSGFGEPLSLSIDYSPISQGVELGQASASSEVDSGADFQIDMYSSLTTTNVLTKTSVTLQSGAVYTMFLAGGAASSQVSGVLRKDR
jgi:hypothetical protein